MSSSIPTRHTEVVRASPIVGAVMNYDIAKHPNRLVYRGDAKAVESGVSRQEAAVGSPEVLRGAYSPGTEGYAVAERLLRADIAPLTRSEALEHLWCCAGDPQLAAAANALTTSLEND